jgi:hypothetical protein
MNTATEYRDLPLNLLTESTTNPRRVFDDAPLSGACGEHPRAGRALTLARPPAYRTELRDRGRSAALPRCADGRGPDRPRPHCPTQRCRSAGGTACRIIYS